MPARTKWTLFAGLSLAACGAMLGSVTHNAATAQPYPLPLPKPAIDMPQDPSTPPLPLDKPHVPVNSEGSPQPGDPDDGRPTPPLPLDKPQNEQDQEGDHPSDPAPEEEVADQPVPWSDAQVADARAQCHELLAGLAITYREVDTLGNADGCGIAAPIEVSHLGNDHPVEISRPAILNCTMAAALHTWVETVLQPAALAQFEAPVERIQNASAYACRRRNNKPGGKLSEHALGNAFDVSAFFWNDGTQVTVKDGWPSLFEDFIPDAQARFLTAVHSGACTVFSTILGPETNTSHEDHFHFDLGRGGRYLICE